jgi:hypothetical protein
MPDQAGVVVAFKDIEEQRAAEQRCASAGDPRNGRPAGLDADQAGFFHYANPAALAALGYEEVSSSWATPPTSST